jgi:hypothetical protein
MPVYTAADFIKHGPCPECGEPRDDGSCECGCWHYDYEDFCVMHDPDDDDDGERDSCEECGESFNVNESGDEFHCARHAGDEGGES